MNTTNNPLVNFQDAIRDYAYDIHDKWIPVKDSQEDWIVIELKEKIENVSIRISIHVHEGDDFVKEDLSKGNGGFRYQQDWISDTILVNTVTRHISL